MDVTFNTATSGMQVSMARQNTTAHNIANAATPGFQQMNTQQAEASPAGVRVTGYTRTPNPNPSESGTDLAQQMVNLNVNNDDFTANTKVFKVQDQMIGTAIDMIA